MYYWLHSETHEVMTTETREVPADGWVEATKKAYDFWLKQRNNPGPSGEGEKDIYRLLMEDAIERNINAILQNAA